MFEFHLTKIQKCNGIKTRSVERLLAGRPKIKDGVVHDEVLKQLSARVGISWKPLARRLNFDEAEITGFDKENKEYAKTPLRMLQGWKRKNTWKATYGALYEALAHKFVGRKDLAEKFSTVVIQELN